MKRTSADGEFLRWKQSVDDALRRFSIGRTPDTITVRNIVLSVEDQPNGSTILYAHRLGAPKGSRVAVATIPK